MTVWSPHAFEMRLMRIPNNTHPLEQWKLATTTREREVNRESVGHANLLHYFSTIISTIESHRSQMACEHAKRDKFNGFFFANLKLNWKKKKRKTNISDFWVMYGVRNGCVSGAVRIYHCAHCARGIAGAKKRVWPFWCIYIFLLNQIHYPAIGIDP